MPESQPVASDVDVWETLSVLVHVTVSPTATPTSSGEKALFPSTSAPLGMVTCDDGPVSAGVGAGDGDDGDDE
jgi:hypothetical protein